VAGTDGGGGRPGPPPLHPFGLVLHHDGSWTHQGEPVLHTRLREAFDRGVRYLPDEGVYVVQIGHFRGQIEIEEAAFTVRVFDAQDGRLTLSDGSREALDPGSLRTSTRDGGLLCSVKASLVPGGLPARFSHAAQAELLAAVEEERDRHVLVLAGRRVMLPEMQ